MYAAISSDAPLNEVKVLVEPDRQNTDGRCVSVHMLGAYTPYLSFTIEEFRLFRAAIIAADVPDEPLPMQVPVQATVGQIAEAAGVTLTPPMVENILGNHEAGQTVDEIAQDMSLPVAVVKGVLL